jgi:hypothetical protein
MGGGICTGAAAALVRTQQVRTQVRSKKACLCWLPLDMVATQVYSENAT